MEIVETRQQHHRIEFTTFQGLRTSRPIFSVHVIERNDSDGVRPWTFRGSRPWPSA